MNKFALLDLLAEVVLLSTFPFIFYWFTRPLPTSSGKVIIGKVIIGIVCVMCYLFVCAMYAIFWIASGMSGGGAGPYPLERLLQSPLQVALLVLVLPAAAVWLAVAKKGTLGLWVFAIGAGFTSFWAGLGWLPAEMDWRFVIAFAVIGGLCGMAAGFILSRVSQPQERSGKVLFWSAAGASSAAIGMLASWPGVQRAMQKVAYRQPSAIEFTPFSIDPLVMLPLLFTTVVVWLSLSTLVALATGYIKLGRGLPTHSAAPE
jgi:hypothetical protein